MHSFQSVIPIPDPTIIARLVRAAIRDFPSIADSIAKLGSVVIWPILVAVVLWKLWSYVARAANTLADRIGSDNLKAAFRGVEISVSREIEKAALRNEGGTSSPPEAQLPEVKVAVLREVESLRPTTTVNALYELVLSGLRRRAQLSDIAIYAPDATAQDIAVNLAYQGKLDAALLAEVQDFQDFTASASRIPSERLDATTLRVYQDLAERLLVAIG